MDISFESNRREYGKDKINIENLPRQPIVLLEEWVVDAKKKCLDPTAMTLATTGNKNLLTQRTVLLKEIIDQKIVFYTNLNSRKAKDIAANKNVSLHFLWKKLERQVSICGTATLLERSKVEKYFASRPKESQIAAIISPQSQTIESREYLEKKYQEQLALSEKQILTAPDYWGGYIVQPNYFEFWQGREHRLHDRVAYTENKDGWSLSRLAP